MEKDFRSFINIHKDEPILLLGSSPNLSNFPFNQFKGKIISFGDAIYRGRDLFEADYWIAANNEFPIPEIPMHLKLINTFKNTTFIFSDTAAYDILFKKSEDFLNKNLKVDWSCFDERHFERKKCVPKRLCCDLLDKYPERITLQELTTQHFNHHEFPKRGATVAESALGLALLMGGNPIFIQGVELVFLMKDYHYYPDKKMDKIIKDTDDLIGEMYKKHYRKNLLLSLQVYIPALIRKMKSVAFPQDYQHKPKRKSVYGIFGLDKVVKNFEIYRAMAEKSGVSIYNLSKNSTLNKKPTFEYLSQEEVIKLIN